MRYFLEQASVVAACVVIANLTYVDYVTWSMTAFMVALLCYVAYWKHKNP